MYSETNERQFQMNKSVKNPNNGATRQTNMILDEPLIAKPHGRKETINHRSVSRQPWLKEIVQKKLKQICKEKTSQIPAKNELLVCPFCSVECSCDEERNAHMVQCVRIYSKMNRTYNCKFFQCEAKFISVENRDEHHKTHFIELKKQIVGESPPDDNEREGESMQPCINHDGVLEIKPLPDDYDWNKSLPDNNEHEGENIQPYINHDGVLEIKPLPDDSDWNKNSICQQESISTKTTEVVERDSGVFGSYFDTKVTARSLTETTVPCTESFHTTINNSSSSYVPLPVIALSTFDSTACEAEKGEIIRRTHLQSKIAPKAAKPSKYVYYKRNGFTLKSCSVVLRRLKLTPKLKRQIWAKMGDKSTDEFMYHDLRWMSGQSKYATQARQFCKEVGAYDHEADSTDRRNIHNNLTFENYLLQ